ncbi:hypothetical protein HGI15_20730 [Modestobacter lapidis]|nr:hypothetical protein [Modestobacter lapidis]
MPVHRGDRSPNVVASVGSPAVAVRGDNPPDTAEPGVSSSSELTPDRGPTAVLG